MRQAGVQGQQLDQAPEHQRRVDDLVARVRIEGKAPAPTLFKPAPPLPGPSSHALDHRMAEEIECIRRHLELLGGTLAADPILLHRHASQLQSIDLIDQLLGHLARVISSANKELAVEQVSLQDLRARLQRKPILPLTGR